MSGIFGMLIAVRVMGTLLTKSLDFQTAIASWALAIPLAALSLWMVVSAFAFQEIQVRWNAWFDGFIDSEQGRRLRIAVMVFLGLIMVVPVGMMAAQYHQFKQEAAARKAEWEAQEAQRRAQSIEEMDKHFHDYPGMWSEMAKYPELVARHPELAKLQPRAPHSPRPGEIVGAIGSP